MKTRILLDLKSESRVTSCMESGNMAGNRSGPASSFLQNKDAISSGQH